MELMRCCDNDKPMAGSGGIYTYILAGSTVRYLNSCIISTMKSLNKFPPEYFLKYRETPVKLKPYNSIQQEIGDYYIDKFKDLLQEFDVYIALKGSSLYKILGKGEVEVGIYPKEADWDSIIDILQNNLGEPKNVEMDYVRFNQVYKDKEVEIIILKGPEAVVDRKLQEYLCSHKDLLDEYTRVKQQNAFSKREYQIQKNKFLSKVIEMIPE